jgi:hypothetical protein
VRESVSGSAYARISQNGECAETRCSGSDLEFLSPRSGRGRARFFRAEGLDITLDLLFPVDKAYAALQDGAVDLVEGSAHSALAAFPRFDGVRLVCALAQGMYWFVVMHADLPARRGDLSVIKGRSIGAAPWVALGLQGVLRAAGIDPQSDGVTDSWRDRGEHQFRTCSGSGAGGAQDRRILG